MTAALVLPETTEADGHSRLCQAKKRQGEGYCQQPSGWGTDHAGVGRCKFHGGNTATQRAAAHAQIAEATARQMFGHDFQAKPIHNPLDAFAEIAGTVHGWMQLMQRLVEDLGSPRYETMTGEQIRGEVQLFERALDRCNTVLGTYAKLNIDERLARIEQAKAERVLRAVEAALAAAGVAGARAIEAKRVAARVMQVVDAEVVETPVEIVSSTP